MSARTIMIMMMMMMMDEEDEIEIISPADRTHELIGDGSQPYALPTINSKHDRFKRIDAATLVRLIDGNFRDMIESFTIVDCRYPYEYQGGHIVNSINVHTGNELVKLFIDKKPNAHHHHHHHHQQPPPPPPQQQPNQAPPNQASQQPQQTPRHIIIFHCEFSSERGPRLMRLLREKDRQINKYPELLHPELYLLDGGYREFYKRYKEYCVPQAYKPMKSRNHREELKNYRKRRRIAQPRRKENRTPDISFEG